MGAVSSLWHESEARASCFQLSRSLARRDDIWSEGKMRDVAESVRCLREFFLEVFSDSLRGLAGYKAAVHSGGASQGRAEKGIERIAFYFQVIKVHNHRPGDIPRKVTVAP